MIAIAEQAAGHDPSEAPHADSYQWVYLLPLVAVYLDRGDTGAAVARARQVLEPGQQVLPDELATRVRQACRAWDEGTPGQAAECLRAALDVAGSLGYF